MIMSDFLFSVKKFMVMKIASATLFLLQKKAQITLNQLAFTYAKQTMETPEKSPKSEIVYCSDVFTIDFKKVNID